MDISIFEFGSICSFQIGELVKNKLANTVDPDETTHDEAPHLDPH